MHTVNSRFIELPGKRLVKLAHDLTQDEGPVEIDHVLYSLSPEEVQGSTLRIEFKVFQDQASTLDRDTIKAFYLNYQAKDVDVRIIRIPRENVRSEHLLKLSTLREKILERARLASEEVPETVLAKADALETTPAEELVKGIGA